MPATVNVQLAIQWMTDNWGLVPSRSGHDISTHSNSRVEREWENYEWPLRTPETSPKPLWEDIVQAHTARCLERGWRPSSVDYIFRVRLDRAVDEVAGDPVPGPEDTEVHAGSGFAHMDGLHARLTHSGEAGVHFRPSVLRRADGGTVNIYTRSELESVVIPIAEAKDLAESAKNLFAADLLEKRRLSLVEIEKSTQDGLTNEQRRNFIEQAERLQTEFLELSDDAKKQIIARLDIVRNNKDLPNDPERARAVFKMRAGVVANQRRNWVLGVVETQEAHLPPSCIEERDALQAISFRWQLGVRRIERAQTVAEMETAYNQLVAEIAAVKVLNTPIWWDGSKEIAEARDGIPELTVTWNTASPPGGNLLLDIRADSPPSIAHEPEGIVSIDALEQEERGPPHSTRIWFLRRYTNPEDGDGRMRCSLQYVTPTIPPPATTVLFLHARNACGPSTLRVRINRVDPPPAP